MKNVKNITRVELAQMLKDPKNYRGCSFVGLDMITEVGLTGGKANPMQGKVQKVHTGFVAMLFSNKLSSAYGNMVNRRLEQDDKEANFEPSKLPWGVREPQTAYIDHTNAKGEYCEYAQLIYVQHAVKLIDLVDNLNVKMNDNDAQLVELLNKKVIGYNTPNGNISYLLDGQPIEKDAIEGMKASSSNGKQGVLSDEMKVIVRSPKMQSITRITMNGTTFNVVD